VRVGAADGIDELLKAESTQPGHAAYNLACVCAKQEKETDSRKWLQRAKALGKLPSRDHIDRDPDFQTVRDRQWFKEFLDGSYHPQNAVG
jgi:hypothetical protein